MNEDIKDMPEKAGEKKDKKRLPLFAIISLALGGISAILYVCFMLSEGFSDFFNRYISSVLRAALAYATGWIPFSLGEYLLLLSPLLIVGAAIYGCTRYVDTWREVFIYCANLLSVIAIVLSVFVMGFAPAEEWEGKSLVK